MLLILLSIVAIATGIVLSMKFDHDVLGTLVALLSGVCLLGMLAFLVIKPIDVKGQIIKYEEMTASIEQVKNSSMSDVEKAAYNATLTKTISGNYNSNIRMHREFVSSPWVGWFYSKKIAELDLIKLD